MTEQIPMAPRIQIGVDPCGDPFLLLHIVTPPGTFISADAVDQLALKLVAAAAAARLRAGIVRDQLLAGADTGEAVAFVNGLLGVPGE